MTGARAGEPPDQRALAEELQAHKERLEMTTAQGRVGTWRTDVRNGSTVWDAGLERIFGLPPGSFGGSFEDFLAVVHPEDREAVSSEVRAALERGVDYVLEHRAVLPSGEVRWVEGRGRVVRDDSGLAFTTVGVAIDVTDRKRAELVVAAQSDRLRALADASLAIASTLSLDEIATRVAEHAQALTGADGAAVELDPGADQPLPPGSLRAALTAHDGSTVGWLSVLRSTPFDSDDEAVITQLARVAAAAIGNARSYARERSAAQSLQRRLLQDHLPVIPGVDLAARYVPAGALEVGGDWYDVLDLGHHRVAIAVGDVMGRGIEAASVMGQIRVGFRAYALEGLPPAEALLRLGRLVATLGTESFSTLVFGIVDLAASTLTWASAGHPPLLLLHADRSVTVLACEPAPPIGIGSDRPVQETVPLHPDDVLVAYTDGLVERGDLPISQGLDALAGHLSQVQCIDAEFVVDHILELTRDAQGEDDVAVLVTRVLDRGR